MLRMVKVYYNYNKNDRLQMVKCATSGACTSWLYSSSRQDMPLQVCIKAIWWCTDGGDLLFVGFLGLRLVLIPLFLCWCIIPFFGLFVGLLVVFVRAGLLGALGVGNGLLGTV